MVVTATPKIGLAPSLKTGNNMSAGKIMSRSH
jgi:hypothetical protein